MKIEISKEFPRAFRGAIKNAVVLTAVHKPMPDLHSVRVAVVPRKKRGDVEGYAFLDTKKRIGKIFVSPENSLAETLDTVFHEAVHISQCARGDLEFMAGKIRWKKWPLISNGVYYKAHGLMPFEREAIKFAEKMTVNVLRDVAKARGVPTKQVLAEFDEIFM
jgi:hypothetical protein